MPTAPKNVPCASTTVRCTATISTREVLSFWESCSTATAMCSTGNGENLSTCRSAMLRISAGSAVGRSTTRIRTLSAGIAAQSSPLRWPAAARSR